MILFASFSTNGQGYNHLLDNYGWCCEKFAGTGAVYGEYYVSGTTFINDTLYKIINDTYYFHEDTLTKQVWFLNEEEKEVIYDFSLELNDTFKIELYGTIIGSYLVSDIDTIETLSGDRKRWHLYLTDSLTIEEGTLTRDLIWIEGIGSTYGPVYPGTIPLENEFGGWGTCLEAVYSVERDQTYQGYCTYIGGYWPDECKFISNRIDHAIIDPISAYFNAVGDLDIKTGGRIDQLCIYDLSGRLVYSCLNNLAEQHITIPNQLPIGIYICELFFETNERFSIKVIKNFASNQ